MKEFTIEKNDAGQRLDRFVGKAVPLLPESLLQKYIRLKRIKVNGKGAKRDYRLALGDTLQLYINDEFFERPREENSYLKVSTPKLHIIYEDDNILLVDKKPGVLCHSAGQWDYNTLIANIQAYAYQKGEWRPKEEHSFAPALCNRIDRNTGGIVIAAKNAEALRIMNEKIKEREIEKYYLCIVHGKPVPTEGTLGGYIFKDAKKNQVYVKHQPEPGAKLSQTKYRVLQSKNGLSLVECELLTGRKWRTPDGRFWATENTAASGKTSSSERPADRPCIPTGWCSGSRPTPGCCPIWTARRFPWMKSILWKSIFIEKLC